MKTTNIKYAVMLICGVMAACGILNSCKLDEPEPTPQEELFLREFIKKYGLIDPNQDWNQAVQAKVTIRVAYAKDINLFVKVADMYYRVASYAEVYDEVVIPVDVPEGTDKIFVDIDGRFFTTTPGGVVDATRAKAPSRGVDDSWSTYFVTQEHWWDVNQKGSICTHFGVEGSWPSWDDSQTYPNLGSYFYKPDNGSVAGTAVTTTNGGASMTLSANDDTSKVYAQFTNNKKVGDTFVAGSFIINFETTATAPATIFIATADGKIRTTLEIHAGTERQELLWLNMDKEAWTQMGIYVETGTVTISNLRISDFDGENMAWLLVAEDLGATDDFDFNDVIIRIEAVNVNAPKLAISLDNKWWQVVEDDQEHMVLGPSSAPSRAGSRAAAYTTLRISAMCAGGTLDSYLHFATGSNDFVLGPNSEPLDLTTATPTTDYTEWHSWFTGSFSEGEENIRDMLNTGLNDATGRSAEIVVPDNFSMANYSVLYKDYDGDPDDFDELGKYNHDNDNKTDGWQYDVTGADADDLIQGFYITVGGPTKENCNTILTAPIAGRAPQMFLIPDAGAGTEGYWKWPRERVPITNVYPRFSKWVKGTDADWYLDTPPTSALTHEDRTVNPPVISLVRN